MPTQGIIYYTCLTHDPLIESMCRVQLNKARGETWLVSVSRGASIDYGDENVIVEGERSPLTMHRQILTGLETIKTDVVFLCESDVLYHPSHFDFTPALDCFCYNTNVWKVRYPDGLAVWTDDMQQVSGVCAYRDVLLDFYSQRTPQIEDYGFNRHYEPGVKQDVGSLTVSNRLSTYPNLCIRHNANLTKSKWSPTEFRNSRYAKGWQTSYNVAGWGDTRELFKEIA